MKTKLLLINIALIFFLIGVLFTVGENLQTGAILILIGSATLLGNYIFHLIQLSKQSKLWRWQTLLLSISLLVPAIIFMHGFSSSMDMTMVFKIKSFTKLYITTGFLLPLLFCYLSINSAQKEDKKWLTLGVSVGTLLCIIGFLGFTRILSLPSGAIYYSWVFIFFFYLVFLAKKYVSNKEKDEKIESLQLLLISCLFLGFWILRFMVSLPMEDGLAKALIYFGFIPMLILPATILSVRKLYSYPVFLFYFVFLDFYFIQYDSNFNYLVDVGLNECEGYNQATDYPTNTDPGISLTELMREPSNEELDEILLEWKEKDFSAKNIEIVHAEQMLNGDSLKIISHLVNGMKHYGAIRIPKSLDVANAPILLELEGGGTGLDISKLRPFTHRRCSDQKDKFISIIPSYRGCIIRGKDFCFRSEGYFGDTWLGPAEDAVALLEAVKELYGKSEDTRVLANGLSRGATVAFIIGGLTDKLDYIIATSTHTKFLDEYVVKNERVGQSYARAFYTPTDSPENIRKRMIASSPYFFAVNLPPFDLHQGAKDDLTTAWHAKALEKRLQEIGKDSRTYTISIYNNHGHGYDDEQAVCQSIANFIEKAN